MRRGAVIAAFAAWTALSVGQAAAPASAAPVSASIDGDTATLNLDGSDNVEAVSVQDGLVVHSGLGGGLKSTADWDSAADGEQTVPADGTHVIVVNGDSGNDAISVVGSGDGIALAELNGGSGADLLQGSDEPDRLVGGSGNDRIEAGGGRDVVLGGDGDDQVDVRDDAPDLASGGDGADEVIADADGVDLLDGFESVDRPVPVAVDPPPVTVTPPPITTEPAPTPTTEPAPTPVPSAAVLPVRISTRTAKVLAGSAVLRISCPALSAGDCAGVLALRTSRGARFGQSRFDLAPGASATVKVKLTRAARGSVARSRHLKAVASATSSGAAQSARTVTLVVERVRTARSRAG